MTDAERLAAILANRVHFPEAPDEREQVDTFLCRLLAARDEMISAKEREIARWRERFNASAEMGVEITKERDAAVAALAAKEVEIAELRRVYHETQWRQLKEAQAERDAAVAALAAMQRIIDAAVAWSAADIVDDSPEGTRLLDEVIAYEAGPPLPARAQALLRVVEAAREINAGRDDYHDYQKLNDALAALDGAAPPAEKDHP